MYVCVCCLQLPLTVPCNGDCLVTEHSKSELRFFASAFEFEIWHLRKLEASVAKMVAMGEFIKLTIDNLDELRFKILLVLANLFSSTMLFLMQYHLTRLQTLF
eukprot:COSAG01_NODE_453_length_16866_cov_30.622175_1_plen_103_part_00